MAVQAPVIINFAGDSGTLGDGITNDNTLTLWGIADANSTVKIYDGSTLLGSVTASGSGSWIFETPKLADSAHTLTATATVAAETSPPSTGMSVTVVPSVTHFVSGTDNWSDPTIIDGQEWYTHSPGKSWSVTNPDSHTVRTEIRPNELWLDGGGERSEIAGPEIADGTLLNISYTMTVEPGTLNPGLSWLSLMQWHEGDTRPFVLLLDGEQMEFVVNLGSAQQQTVYHASSNIQRGQAYDIQYQVKFGTNGSLDVWLDGVQIVDYNGLLGTSSNAQYLKLGVYRGWEGEANYTMAVDYSNITWSTNPAFPTPPYNAPTIAAFSTDSNIVGDGITNDNTLTLSGTAQANSTVKVYDGAALLSTVTANGSGAWSYNTGTLADGTHSFTAAASSGGTTGPSSAAKVVTIDTVAPNVVPTINSFSPDTGVVGDGITDFSALTLTGTAQANSTVNVYDGATLLGAATANGSGAWNFATNTLVNGSHQFTARTMDVAGNTSAASSALTVTVNASPNLVVNGSFETGSTGGWTEGGNSSSDASSIYIAPTEFPGEVHTGSYSVGFGGYSRSDGILSQNIATTAGQHYTVSFWLRVDNSYSQNDLAPDNHFVAKWNGQTLVAKTNAADSGYQQYIFDVVGIAGNSTLEFRGYNLPDAMRLDDISVAAVGSAAPPSPGPVIGINSFSTDSGTVGDGITNDNTLTLTGTATANSTVKVYDGATLLGTTTANGSGAWGYATATLSNGVHSLTATVTDPAGNTSAASAALTVTVDAAAPGAPTIASWSNDTGTLGDGITSDNTLALTGTAEANSTVRVYDGATLLGSVTANGSGAWSYTTAALSNGSHSLTATVTDVAGNTGAASAALAVTISTTAIGAPAITSWSTDTGTAGDGITSDNTLTLTGSAQASSTVRVYDGATLLGTVTANGSGAWSYTTAALSNGSHNLTAKTVDAAGNISAASASLAVTIDTTAGGAPTIASWSTDSGAAGDRVTNDNTLALTGTTQANGTVRVYDGATLLGTATANGSGAWSYTTAALSNGSHSLTATTTDAAGNTSVASSPLTVTVDTVAPSAPTITSFSSDTGTVGDRITSDNTLALTGTTEANSTVRLFDGATLLGTATANGSGAWSYTTAALSNGSHSLTATATDVAGNTGAGSAALTVTVDTTPPPAPTIASFSNDTGAVGDRVTHDNTLTLTGSTQSNGTVRIYDEATLLGTVTSSGSGAWSFTTAALAQGKHSFTARAADVAGNTAASAAFTVTIANQAPTIGVDDEAYSAGTSVAASSLFSVSDADGDAVVTYRLYDQSPSGSSGRFLVNGVDQGSNHNIDLTPAQLAQTTFVAGSVQDRLWVQVYDGMAWSEWYEFHNTPLANGVPTVNAPDKVLAAGTSVAASSLFSVSDADGNSIVTYRLYDQSPSSLSGRFLLNGVDQGFNHNIDLTPAQLAQSTYVAGSVEDHLWVQVYDGTTWSEWYDFYSQPRNPAGNHAPTVNVVDKANAVGTSVAASSLFSVSDADGNAVVAYRLYDQSPSSLSGRFLLNGVDQGYNHNIDLTPAQFAQTTYVAGTIEDRLWVQVYDGAEWSPWYEFKNTPLAQSSGTSAELNAAPVVTVADVSVEAGEQLSAASLFFANDPDGDAIVGYRLYDQSPGANTGRFLLNGVDQGTNHNIDLTPAQLAQTTYLGGAEEDHLWFQVYDGHLWSAWYDLRV